MRAQDESFKFVGAHYKRGNRFVRLKVGDEVIIHPTRWGRSQAKKSYPAKIVIGSDWKPEYLCVKGIKDNSNWCGARINQYAFNRLEFVKREENEN
jgi:hypothetical protein